MPFPLTGMRSSGLNTAYYFLLLPGSLSKADCRFLSATQLAKSTRNKEFIKYLI